jgi:hypothetical protein
MGTITSIGSFAFNGGPGFDTMHIFNDNSASGYGHYVSPSGNFSVIRNSNAATIGMPWSNVERIVANGSAFADAFAVWGSDPGVAYELNGLGGNDTYNFGSIVTVTLQTNRGAFSINGGTGDDVINLNYADDTVGRTFHLAHNSFGATPGDNVFGLGGSLHFTSINGSINITAGSGADTVYARPNATAAVTINGANPTVAPGDQLTLALAGALNYVVNGTPASGNVTSTNLRTLTWSNFETGPTIDAVAPSVNSTNFLFDGNTLPNAPHRLVVEFSENVGASLAVTDFQILNLTTSQTIAPANLALSYSSGTNRATITFPGLPGQILPDGNYRLTINAGDVSDGAGNTMLSNYVFDQNFWFFNGDLNRDRTINGLDFNILAPNFAQSPRIWSQGDLNYDGVVNGLDFNILAPKFATSLPAPFARPGENPPTGGGSGGDSRGGMMRWGTGPGSAPLGGSTGSSGAGILAPLGFKTPVTPFGDERIGLPTDGGGIVL